jgi:hypothetical protein
LTALRKEIKKNIDNRKEDTKEPVENILEDNISSEILVQHGKYGEGRVVHEDNENITVLFETYGEKTFSKMFSQLKYL